MTRTDYSTRREGPRRLGGNGESIRPRSGEPGGVHPLTIPLMSARRPGPGPCAEAGEGATCRAGVGPVEAEARSGILPGRTPGVGLRGRLETSALACRGARSRGRDAAGRDCLASSRDLEAVDWRSRTLEAAAVLRFELAAASAMARAARSRARAMASACRVAWRIAGIDAE